ncbi:CLUMA_CG016011, isoform A [Clunio marinus]|uniref:Odorant receptor n=1 Tax=Clunio marinus TaxID=568069 RepID=A0A1J1IT68_9DIPT|nr:CLUMA_CG016011, isoform A [Clunio marinus]
MDAELYKPFKLTFFILKKIGMLQDGEQSWIYFVCGYFFHFIVIYVYIFGQLTYLINAADLMDFSEGLALTTTFIALSLRSINFFRKINKIKTSVEALNKLLRKTDHEASIKDRKFIRQEVSFCYKVYLAFLFSGILTLTSGAFVPVINNKVPYKFWFPFDTNKETSEVGFWIASYILVLHSFPTGILDISLCMLPVIFMAFAIGLLRELSERLKKIKTIEELVQCVTIHQEIKLFIKDIHGNFAETIFFQGIMSSLTLCTGVFTMSVTENLTQLIRIITFLIPMLLEIFLPCYFGNELSIASSTLTTSIFQSNWIDGDMTFKRALMIFTECNRKELKITSLGLFDVNIATFSSIGRSAYSVFNVLKQSTNRNSY